MPHIGRLAALVPPCEKLPDPDWIIFRSCSTSTRHAFSRLAKCGGKGSAARPIQQLRYVDDWHGKITLELHNAADVGSRHDVRASADNVFRLTPSQRACHFRL